MRKFVITGITGAYTLPDNLSKNATRFGIVLEVDTTAAVAEIQLPSASVYGVPITIFDKEGNAATNNITILPILTVDSEESIEGEVELVISENSESVILAAVDDLTWSMESLADPESDVETLQTDVAALEAVAPIPFSVTFSDLQIKAGLGTVGLQVLPTPGAGNYYEYFMTLKLNYGSVDYTWTMTSLEVLGVGTKINPTIITGRGDSLAHVSSYTHADPALDYVGAPEVAGLIVDMPLVIKGSGGVVGDPEVGNSTLTVVGTYKIKSFDLVA